MDIVESINRYLAGSPVNKGERTRLIRARDEIMRLRTSPQPEQEPVAWQVEVLVQGVWTPMGNPQRDKDRAEKLADNPSIPKECQRIIELYTALPKRKPLTDEQKQQIHNETGAGHALICLVEAELKEKNT